MSAGFIRTSKRRKVPTAAPLLFSKSQLSTPSSPISEMITVVEQFLVLKPLWIKIVSRNSVFRIHSSSPVVSCASGFFSLCVFKVRVPEDTSLWKDILQISAQDADTNSKLVYSVHSSLHPDSTKFFHLDPKSGVLVLTEELDYERIAVHTLIVMVMPQLWEYSRMGGICSVWHGAKLETWCDRIDPSISQLLLLYWIKNIEKCTN